jgi:hypothetical protein
MGRLFIGTSGYSYQHWRGVFYPKDLAQARWLEFYCEHFATVELNVTFYRLPKAQTFEGWYKRTPPDFCFVAKGSRFITHVKKLNDCGQPLQLFKERAFALGEKLACILAARGMLRYFEGPWLCPVHPGCSWHAPARADDCLFFIYPLPRRRKQGKLFLYGQGA